jgi:hypothetical protein
MLHAGIPPLVVDVILTVCVHVLHVTLVIDQRGNGSQKIAAGAEANVQSDWNATSGDAFIKNKPTKVSQFTNDAGYLTQHQDISGKLDKVTTPSNRMRAYTVNAYGSNVLTPISSITFDNNSLVARHNNGNIYTNEPQEDNSCTNKKYVDDIVGNIKALLEAI